MTGLTLLPRIPLVRPPLLLSNHPSDRPLPRRPADRFGVLQPGGVLRDVLRDGVVLHQELAELLPLGDHEMHRLADLAGREVDRPDEVLAAGRHADRLALA